MPITAPTFLPDGTAVGDQTNITLDQTKISTPLRTTGYADGAKLAAKEYNEMFKELTQWTKWFSWLTNYLGGAVSSLQSTVAGLISSLGSASTHAATDFEGTFSKVTASLGTDASHNISYPSGFNAANTAVVGAIIYNSLSSPASSLTPCYITSTDYFYIILSTNIEILRGSDIYAWNACTLLLRKIT